MCLRGPQIRGLAMHDDQYLATCDEDGNLRVWSVKDREQTLQFQVMEQVRNMSDLFRVYKKLSSG